MGEKENCCRNLSVCGFEEQMYTETGVQRIGKWRHRIIRGF